jgi:WD40 repeat protein
MISRQVLLACTLLLLACAVSAAGGQPPEDKDQALPPGALHRLGSMKWRHTDHIGFAAFLPGGKSVVSVGDDLTMRVWEFPSGKEIRRVSLPAADMWKSEGKKQGSLPIAALSKDGRKLATCFWGDVVRLYDIATGKLLHAMGEPRLAPGGQQPGPLKQRNTLTFDPAGVKLFSVTADGIVEEWDTNTGKLLQTRGISRTKGHGFDPLEPRMALSPDGKTLLTYGTGHLLHFHDVASGNEVAPSLGHSSVLFSIRYSPDGKEVLTCDCDGSIHRWDALTGRDLGAVPIRGPGAERPKPFGVNGLAMRPNPNGIHAVVPSPDAKTFANGPDVESGAKVVVVDVATGKYLGKFGSMDPKAGPKSVLKLTGGVSFAFSSDGKTIGVSWLSNWHEQKLDLFDIASGNLLHSLDVSLGNDKKLIKLSIPDWRKLELATPLFSPDGAKVATYAGDATYIIWNAKNGDKMGSIVGQFQEPRHAIFSRDGRSFAVDQGDGTVALFDTAGGAPLRTFGEKSPDAAIPAKASFTTQGDALPQVGPSVDLSANGRLLALAGLDRMVHIWDIASGKKLAAFKGHEQVVNAVAFAPDSKTLASASADSIALIWDVSKLRQPSPPRR